MTWSGMVPAPCPPGGPPPPPLGGQNWPATPVQPAPVAGVQQGADAAHPLLTKPVKEVSYTTGPHGESYRMTKRSGTEKLSYRAAYVAPGVTVYSYVVVSCDPR